MGFLSKLKAYSLTAVSVVSRAIYNTGQTLYSMGNVMTYFGSSGHPAATAATAVAGAGSALSTALGKTVPTYHKLSNTDEQQDSEEESTLGWSGTIVKYGLRTSSLVYGGMTSVSAYFLTVYLSKALDSMISSDPNTALWKEIMIQGAGGIVAVANLVNYYTNDYQFVKGNSYLLAESIDQRHIACNIAMAKTLGAASLNLLSYPMQAFFFAKPSISNLPYVGKHLGTVGTNALSGLASATTFLTVVSWLPTIYKHFSTKPESHDQAAVISNNCGTISYKVAAYTAGAIDSLGGGGGLGMYISVITTMSQIFGLNPYGWIIGLAALCGLNATIMNLLFSVKQGEQTTLAIIFRSDASQPADLENQALLSGVDTLPEGIYQSRGLSETLLFGTCPVTGNIQEAAPDAAPIVAASPPTTREYRA
jgi:hypothetical protein